MSNSGLGLFGITINKNSFLSKQNLQSNIEKQEN